MQAGRTDIFVVLSSYICIHKAGPNRRNRINIGAQSPPSSGGEERRREIASPLNESLSGEGFRVSVMTCGEEAKKEFESGRTRGFDGAELAELLTFCGEHGQELISPLQTWRNIHACTLPTSLRKLRNGLPSGGNSFKQRYCVKSTKLESTAITNIRNSRILVYE